MFVRGDGIYSCELCEFYTRFTYNSKEAHTREWSRIRDKHLNKFHNITNDYNQFLRETKGWKS